MLTATEIEEVFRGLVPSTAKVSAMAVADAPERVVPPELKGARPERLQEFRAGRACARRVLEQLGARGEVGRDAATREPLWPKGVAGSISHTRTFAVAAAGFVPALGIDFEPFLSPEALRDVRQTAISDAEWKLLGESPELATALFSAKESLFKCLWPATKVFLEFDDAALVARDERSLVLRVAGEELRAAFAVMHGHAFTAVGR